MSFDVCDVSQFQCVVQLELSKLESLLVSEHRRQVAKIAASLTSKADTTRQKTSEDTAGELDAELSLLALEPNLLIFPLPKDPTAPAPIQSGSSGSAWGEAQPRELQNSIVNILPAGSSKKAGPPDPVIPGRPDESGGESETSLTSPKQMAPPPIHIVKTLPENRRFSDFDDPPEVHVSPEVPVDAKVVKRTQSQDADDSGSSSSSSESADKLKPFRKITDDSTEATATHASVSAVPSSSTSLLPHSHMSLIIPNQEKAPRPSVSFSGSFQRGSTIGEEVMGGRDRAVSIREGHGSLLSSKTNPNLEANDGGSSKRAMTIRTSRRSMTVGTATLEQLKQATDRRISLAAPKDSDTENEPPRSSGSLRPRASLSAEIADATKNTGEDGLGKDGKRRSYSRAQSMPSSRRGSVENDCTRAADLKRTSTVSKVALEPEQVEKKCQIETERASLSQRDESEPATSEGHPDDHYEVLELWVAPVRKSRRSLGAGQLQKEATQVGNVFDAPEVEEEQKEKEKVVGMQRFMLWPGCWQHVAWDLLGLVFVVWDCIYIPFLTFDPDNHWTTDFLGWSARLYWTAALGLVFVIGFINNKGAVEMRPSFVARRYLATWFSLDSFLVVIDWLEVFGPSGDGIMSMSSTLRGLRVLRTIRLLRLIKAPMFFRYLTEQIRSEELILVATIVKIMASMLLVVHFLACGWYGLAAADFYEESWVKAPGSDVINKPLSTRYTVSFHWSLSTFSGETLIAATNIGERLYTCLVLFFAFMFSASLVSSMTTAMTRLEIMSRQNTQHQMQLRRYLGDQNISSKLSVRVQRNARHVVLEQKRNMPESSVALLTLISQPLLVELHYEVRSPALVDHPFFSCFDEINPAGIRKVCHTAVKQVTVSSGDVLFSDGEAPTTPSMYFITSGEVRYKQELTAQAGEQPLNVVLNGGDGLTQWLCEGVLWTHWTHHGTLRVESEHSRLIVIDAKEFQDICAAFAMMNIQRYAEAYVEALNAAEKCYHTDLGLDMETIMEMICMSFPELLDYEESDDEDDDDDDKESNDSDDGHPSPTNHESESNEITIIPVVTGECAVSEGPLVLTPLSHGTSKHLSPCMTSPGSASVPAVRMGSLNSGVSAVSNSWRMGQSLRHTLSFSSKSMCQKLGAVFKRRPKKGKGLDKRGSVRASVALKRGNTQKLGGRNKRFRILRQVCGIVFLPCLLLCRCFEWLFPKCPMFKSKVRKRRLSDGGRPSITLNNKLPKERKSTSSLTPESELCHAHSAESSHSSSSRPSDHKRSSKTSLSQDAAPNPESSEIEITDLK